MSKVFYNSKLAKTILFKGYSTIMLFGYIFTKKESLMPSSLRHELIHCEQYKECIIAFLIPFAILCIFYSWWWLPIYFLMYYIIYGVEYLISLIYNIFKTLIKKEKFDISKINHKAYKASAFEIEACENEEIEDYLDHRKGFAFIKYYGKL